MSKVYQRNVMVMQVLAAAAMLVAACTPAVPREQVRQEVGAAMLADLRARADGAGHEVPVIIIWAEASTADPESRGPDAVDHDRPIEVLVYEGDGWSQPEDMRQAIEAYYAAYVNAAGSRRWDVRSFAVTQVSADGNEAQVMVNSMCGPLCGQGTLVTLRRNERGGWETVKEEGTWIS